MITTFVTSYVTPCRQIPGASQMLRSLLTLVLAAQVLTGCLPQFSRPPAFDIPFGEVADTLVRVGVLENGLTYFVRPNAEPQRRAELRLVVNAGSVLEDPDQRGLAHVVEHMAFNGTRNFARDSIVDYLESIGMRFGPDLNAYTSFDETVYMLTIPTDTAGALETGIAILADWAGGIVFDSAQVEQERQVVIEEWRLGQGAGSRLQYRQFPTLAYRSRYAQRLPIGTPESLANFDHEALERFYRDWYRPELMAVVAVGDVDPDAVEAMIREKFGGLTGPEDPRPRREYPVPDHRETLVTIASDPELTASTVSLYMKRRPDTWRKVADYRNWVAESLASGMLINRLSELSQRQDAPILDVSSYQGRFVRTLTTFGLTARTPDDEVARGLQVLLQEVERAARFGFTRTELERQKREMLRVAAQRYAERDRTTSNSHAADLVSYYLYGGTILGADLEYSLYQTIIADIQLSETSNVARRWTRAANRVLLISAPEKDDVDLPSEEFLESIIRVSRLQPLAPYVDRVSEAPLMATVPVPGSIVEESMIESVGIISWTLSNGSRVFLKPTTFRQDEVLFAARSPGGTSLVDDADYIPALTAAAVVQAGGLGELSANDLRKRLTGRVAGVGADISERYEGLSGAASPEDLELLFQLVHLKFTAPRPDSAAFFAYRSQARASLANRALSPDVVFLDTLRLTLANGHMRAQPPSSAMFDALDMERSFEIYRDRFADASDFVFHFVGNFDPEELRPLVETYLASLPSLDRKESPRDLGIRPPRGVIEKTVFRGMEPRAATQIIFTGPTEFSRANLLHIQTLADVLGLRLRETLREDLGGTYSVSVRGSATPSPVPQYQFSIAFGSDPERVDELVDAIFAEIEAIRTDGPHPEDLAKVREMQFRSREVDLRQNQFWLQQMIAYTLYEWDLAQIPAAANRSEPIDPVTIAEAARKYLDLENYVRASLLPASAFANTDSR